MKTLYFDINGTIAYQYRCKPALANGAFEQAIRKAGFERLVCMSNIQDTIKLLAQMGKRPDGMEITFEMCWGAFRDKEWFRQVATLVADPDLRARYIDVATDWWYVDDLAKEYLEKEGFADLYKANVGLRILAPTADSDGEDVLRWLQARLKPK